MQTGVHDIIILARNSEPTVHDTLIFTSKSLFDSKYSSIGQDSNSIHRVIIFRRHEVDRKDLNAYLADENNYIFNRRDGNYK